MYVPVARQAICSHRFFPRLQIDDFHRLDLLLRVAHDSSLDAPTEFRPQNLQADSSDGFS